MPEPIEGFNSLKKEYLNLLVPSFDELVLTKMKLKQLVSKNYPGQRFDGEIATLKLNLESITAEIMHTINFIKNERGK